MSGAAVARDAFEVQLHRALRHVLNRLGQGCERGVDQRRPERIVAGHESDVGGDAQAAGADGAQAIGYALQILEQGEIPPADVVLETEEVAADNAGELLEKHGGGA